MHPTLLAASLQLSRTTTWMCAAGIAILVIGALAPKEDIAAARGLDKIVALSNLCFAIPLAVFGALHLFAARSLSEGVPRYMPWRLFWAYLVGCALIAGALSIAAKIAVRWSGLLFGIMMFLFVAMIHLPGALAKPHDRILWTIVFREMAFGGGGWVLAAAAKPGWRGHGKSMLTIVGRILIAAAAIAFGIQHFLHPLGLPGVPLVREMPAWVPQSVPIDYVTGAALVAAGICFLLALKTRLAATYLGAWLLLLVVAIYGPVLITSLSNPSTSAQIEGINYFADTLLFAGAILALASATSTSVGQQKKAAMNAA